MSSYAFAYTRTARAYELTPDGQDLTRGLVRELYAGGVFFFCIFFLLSTSVAQLRYVYAYTTYLLS